MEGVTPVEGLKPVDAGIDGGVATEKSGGGVMEGSGIGGEGGLYGDVDGGGAE